MVLIATFNNISVNSWWSVLLVEKTGVLGENHRPVASHWHFITECCIEHTSSGAEFELTVLVVDYIGNCKSNYNTTTATTALNDEEIVDGVNLATKGSPDICGNIISDY